MPMEKPIAPAPLGVNPLRRLGALAACLMLAAALLGCADLGEDSAAGMRVLASEAQTRALEETLAALADENAELKREIALLRERVDDLDVRVDGLDDRIEELEAAAAKTEAALFAQESWDKDKREPLTDDAVLERTAQLAAAAGGEVHYVDHPGRKNRTVLVTPQKFVDGKTPLIVSLHGFGGNAADHAAYVPLHERVNSHGFALLLPNGMRDGAGNRFWNPTDECCDGGKSGEDDMAYLTELVAGARKLKDFGPVYVFGYSNGGFMAYHLACKGLPGLRAVASLTGTSYVEDSSCAGAPPVSVLHVHGTADEVIRYAGDQSEPQDEGEPAFYAGAEEMVTRWSQRAGCAWPDDPQPYANLDLDRHVPGAETHAYRLQESCAPGITIELWQGVGSSHGPAYGDAFVDALLGWLLAQD